MIKGHQNPTESHTNYYLYRISIALFFYLFLTVTMMERFLTSARHSRRIASSQASSSNSSQGPSTPSHHASSRRVAKSEAPVLSPTSSRSSSPAVNPITKEAPDRHLNAGLVFAINWEGVYLGDRRLRADRLGYRVKRVTKIRGGHPTSPVWEHGAELQYIEEDGQRLKLWLCRRCHLRGVQAAAKLVNGYQHIERHLFSKHQINVTITKEAPEPISNPWDASFIAGAARASRSWLGEEALVGALIDWSIIQDQSFRAVVSAETRALLSWNRVELSQGSTNFPHHALNLDPACSGAAEGGDSIDTKFICVKNCVKC